MKAIRKIWILPLMTMAAVLFEAVMLKKTSGSHIASTGAPGEATCKTAGCHSDAEILTDTALARIVFGNNEFSYQPGATYSVRVQAQKSGIEKFGFQWVSIDELTEKNVGTVTLTEPDRTQIQTNAPSPISDRRYVTHRAAGTNAPIIGATEWQFNWQAPDTDVGPIVMYAAVNFTNKNNANTGDAILLIERRLESPTSIQETFGSHEPSFIYAENELILLNATQTTLPATITIHNLDGRLFFKKCIQESRLPIKLPPGIYIVSLEGKKENKIGRLFVN